MKENNNYYKNKIFYTAFSIGVSLLFLMVNAIMRFSDNILFAIMLLLGIIATYVLERNQKRSYTPTIWTSLGLLFTFISLLIAFNDLTELNNDTLDLKVILPKVSAAFTTSVAGISISLFFNIMNKSFIFLPKSNKCD